MTVTIKGCVDNKPLQSCHQLKSPLRGKDKAEQVTEEADRRRAQPWHDGTRTEQDGQKPHLGFQLLYLTLQLPDPRCQQPRFVQFLSRQWDG